jgi:hypothetical protein
MLSSRRFDQGLSLSFDFLSLCLPMNRPPAQHLIAAEVAGRHQLPLVFVLYLAFPRRTVDRRRFTSL